MHKSNARTREQYSWYCDVISFGRMRQMTSRGKEKDKDVKVVHACMTLEIPHDTFPLRDFCSA